MKATTNFMKQTKASASLEAPQKSSCLLFMDLISFDQCGIKVVLSHVEFDLLKSYVEHAAEYDHDMIFKHPELLSAFRDILAKIRFAHEEGFLYD